MLLQQLKEGRCEVENQYIRAVNREGNLKSQQMIDEVLELRPLFEWRGLGYIANSALKIKESYREYDAEYRFPLPERKGKEIKGCECGAVLRGIKKPKECKLFEVVCTPENPLGSCMVSSEGACAAVYTYGRM
jgi:hydrogenase expression/formation protein HypD